MARKTSTSKGMVKWDEQLAQDAQIAAEAEAASGGGQFFSTRGGILTWQDAPLPNNEMAVVILDSIFENVFYDGDYDPDVPQAPACFAFAHTEADLTPHQLVVEAGQAWSLEGCASCENNEWGSADKGRGKACRNVRRLAMIPAGTFDKHGDLEPFSADDLAKATIGYMKLPVTSVKGYASFVKQVAGALKRPPYGIVTKVSVVPDPKSQFKVLFEPLAKVTDDLMGAVITRREEAAAVIDFPYMLEEEEAPKPKKRATKKKAAKKKASRKRY